jgi:hypothetical protein
MAQVVVKQHTRTNTSVYACINLAIKQTKTTLANKLLKKLILYMEIVSLRLITKCSLSWL